MTKSTVHTVPQIEALMAQIESLIQSFEAHIAELRPFTSNGAEVLIGFPQYGMYLSGSDIGLGTCGVLYAKRFDIHAAARHAPVTNGKGEVAEIVTVGLAATRQIAETESAITSLWGSYADYEAELCALLDAAADEAAFHDAQGVNEDRGITIRQAAAAPVASWNPVLDGFDYAAMNERSAAKPRRTRPD